MELQALVSHSTLLKAGLTLKVAGDIVLDLVVARRAEKQSPVHQRKLLKHGQRSVAQRAVDHVPLAGAEGRQDEPTGLIKSLKESLEAMNRMRSVVCVPTVQAETCAVVKGLR